MSKENIVIAYFDILGSSNKMRLKSLSQSVKSLNKFSDLTRQDRDCLIIDGGSNTQVQGDGIVLSIASMGSLNIKQDSFSDTGLLWTIFDPPRFWTFCELISDYFCQALAQKIPLRGGISVGEAYMDKNKSVFAGEPMAEVVQVEKLQEWIGVSFGTSFLREPFIQFLKKEHVIEFSDHLKSGYNGIVSKFALNWPRKWKKTNSESPMKLLYSMNTESSYSKYYELAIKFCKKSERAEKLG